MIEKDWQESTREDKGGRMVGGGGYAQGRQFHIQTSLEGNRVENSAQLLSYLPLPAANSFSFMEEGREWQRDTDTHKEKERKRGRDF